MERDAQRYRKLKAKQKAGMFYEWQELRESPDFDAAVDALPETEP